MLFNQKNLIKNLITNGKNKVKKNYCKQILIKKIWMQINKINLIIINKTALINKIKTNIKK